jgi:hypothetical protein
MAANLYTIEDLLIGKLYRSENRHFSGKIVSVEKSDLWYGENTQAYVVAIKTPNIKYKYATIAVKTGE